MAARLAPRRLSALADDDSAALGAGRVPRDRFSRISTTTQRRSRLRGRNRSTEVDPELLRTYAKLGIPLVEQEILAGVERTQVAVDAVFGLGSVATTFKAELAKAGVIFCSFSESGARARAIWCVSISARSCRRPTISTATLNSAVFSDGSFVYVAAGVRCPMELSTYFRIQREEHRPV